jgi:hypothetical protein
MHVCGRGLMSGKKLNKGNFGTGLGSFIDGLEEGHSGKF